MRDAEGLGQSAEHEAYHGDVDPALGAGFGAFVVADEAAVAHEPAEGPFDDPAPGQDLEALGRFVAPDDLYDELGAVAPGPPGRSPPRCSRRRPRAS